FFQGEDGIRDDLVTGVQTCALPIWLRHADRTSSQGRLPLSAGPRRQAPLSPDRSSHERGCCHWQPVSSLEGPQSSMVVAGLHEQIGERRVGKESRDRRWWWHEQKRV